MSALVFPKMTRSAKRARGAALFLVAAIGVMGWVQAADDTAGKRQAGVSAQTGPATARVPVGAIRWDAWVGDLGSTETWKPGGWQELALASDAQWHDRIPFYGKILPDKKVEARCIEQETLDEEIRYAKGALDYWAFWDSPAWSQDAVMGKGLRLYLTSSHKEDINFSIILNDRAWYDHLDDYLAYFREPTYQKIEGGRPLIFIFTEASAPPEDEKLSKLASGIAALRARSVEQGTGSPYVVVMNFKPDFAKKWCDTLEFDAISTYANGGSRGRGEPYQQLRTTAESIWKPYLAQKKPVVLNCMTGWDQRPRTIESDNPRWKEIREKGPGWYQKGTPEEIAAHLAAAAKKCQAEPDQCKAVICYAWNEFTEGGWLCPTLGDGDARLRAIEKLREQQRW